MCSFLELKMLAKITVAVAEAQGARAGLLGGPSSHTFSIESMRCVTKMAPLPGSRRVKLDFSRLRELVQDCLAQGLSTLQARQRVKDALLHARPTHEQAASRCDDNALQGSR
jgi:hypothetical protein